MLPLLPQLLPHWANSLCTSPTLSMLYAIVRGLNS